MRKFLLLVSLAFVGVLALGSTPESLDKALMDMVIDSNLPYVKMLLDLGADVDAATRDGMRPFYYAALAGDKAMMELLQKYLAEDFKKWKFKDPYTFPKLGSTPEGMVLLYGGLFVMGNTRKDREGGYDEIVHPVMLSYDYLIGRTEVTFEDYDIFCRATGYPKPDDLGWGRSNRPVINVSWFDAIAFCNWLSERHGLAPAYDDMGNLLDARGHFTDDITQVEGYRLPTEAEWEYAARGGHHDIWLGEEQNDFKFAGSDDPFSAAFFDVLPGKTRPVGIKQPCEAGLYDMTGNVWEWCHDRYRSDAYSHYLHIDPIGALTGYPRVIRGGSWHCKPIFCRIAFRGKLSPGFSLSDVGFRIARTY